MSYIIVDPLQPVSGKNRNESILVEYEGFVKNVTEALIEQMQMYGDEMGAKYPKIKDYWHMNAFPRYIATVNFTPFEFLTILNDNNHSEEEIKEDIQKVAGENVISVLTDTAIEWALERMQFADFTKEISFVKNGQVFKHEYDYLKRRFGINSKVQCNIYEGDVISLCDDFNYTTIMTNDSNTIRVLIEKDPEKYKQALFLSRKRFSNTDEMEDLQEKGYAVKLCEINFTGPDKITIYNQPKG